MSKIVLRKIGNSVGVILPKEVLARFKLSEGDALSMTESADAIVLSPYDDDVARQVETMRNLAKRYRNTLKTLSE